MFWVFDFEACRILVPWPGIKPTPRALEGEVLTTAPPGTVSDLWALGTDGFFLGLM